jgi:hypothetical protein
MMREKNWKKLERPRAPVLNTEIIAKEVKSFRLNEANGASIEEYNRVFCVEPFMRLINGAASAQQNLQNSSSLF